jgi:hypothetical protein
MLQQEEYYAASERIARRMARNTGAATDANNVSYYLMILTFLCITSSVNAIVTVVAPDHIATVLCYERNHAIGEQHKAPHSYQLQHSYPISFLALHILHSCINVLYTETRNFYAHYGQQLPLLEGWSAFVDSASGNTYYSNALGESTWERPTLLALTYGNNTSSGTGGAAVTSTALVPSVGYDMAGYVSTVCYD